MRAGGGMQRFSQALSIATSLFCFLTLGAPIAAAQTPTLKSAAAASGRYFGAALDPGLLADPDYRKLAALQFSSITAENAMKWPSVEPAEGVFSWTAADDLAAFARASHQALRGHNLLWEGHLPAWVTQEGATPAALRGLIERHVTEEVSRYKGTVYAWDVVNEPFTDYGSWRNGPLHDALGADYVAIALRAARAADPDAKLYINEYNIEGQSLKFAALYALVASLKRAHAPLDGVGLQSHFVVGRVPKDMPAILEKFAALDVDVAITELDIRIPIPASSEALAQQAADYGFVVSACIAAPRCVGVTTWGVSDDHSWIPSFFPGYGDALLFDQRGDSKPAYAAVIGAMPAQKGDDRARPP
jgi:endo-1,4-beta-xylanase